MYSQVGKSQNEEPKARMEPRVDEREPRAEGATTPPHTDSIRALDKRDLKARYLCLDDEQFSKASRWKRVCPFCVLLQDLIDCLDGFLVGKLVVIFLSHQTV